MIRHSSVSVAPALSPINKSPLEENETKKRELPAARRYCTYELNWNDYKKSGINNKKDAVSMNTYKDTASSSNPPSPQTPPTPHPHQSPQEERMSENLAPSLGGITVTVVQKVEVKADSDPVTKRPAVSKIPRPINSVMQRKGRPVQRRSQILLTRTENDQRPDFFQKINSFDTTSNRQVPPGFRGNVPQNISTSQSKSMVNAPTTNPEDSNDPTDMEDENPSTNIRPIIPPKLLHTALVPLEQYRKYKFVQDTLKKIELSLDNDLNHHPRRLSRANSKRKKTLLSSQSTKRPSQLFRQRLLEQSVSMSFAGSGLNKSTSVKPEQGAPKNIDPTPDNNCNLRPCQLPRVNSERKKISNSSTNVKQESLLKKGVSMTLTSPDLEKSTSVNFVQDVQNNNNNNYNNYNNNNTNNNNNNNVNLHPRQLSPGNSRKGGSPISLPSTKRPSQIFRQQLLEQSVSMSLNGSGLNNLTEVKPTQNVLKNTTANITPVNDRNLHPRRLSRVNSKRKKSQSVLSPIVKRESQMFRQRLLEQSISMSLDGSSIKPPQNIPRNVIQTHDNNRNLNTRQLSRVNSRRIRSSSSSPSAKRASQIFRQRLLEQSISMSLAGSGSNSLPQSKLPTRRLSRRAKGREAIKERKSGMDNVNPERSDNKCSPKAVNTLPMLRILESEELYQKVNQEIQRQERLKHLRPPPRKVISDSPAPSFIPTSPRPKNNLISSLPERKTPRPLTPRSVTPTSPRPISIDPLPFPTHLSRRSIMRIPHSITLRIAPMF